MLNLGDYAPGDVVRGFFNSADLGGAPITLAGGVLSAYKDIDDTETVTGVTLELDVDGRTGFHRFAVDTADAFYAAGSKIAVVITTGTVDSVSVVGRVVGYFTLGAVSALRPTVPTRTLDVSATGEAGLDWANIGAPTTVQGLSGTTIKDVTDVLAQIAVALGRLPASLVGGRMDASMGAVAGVADVAIALSKSAAGIIRGSAVSGTLTTTQMTSSLTPAPTSVTVLAGRRIVFISGALFGQQALISAYDPGATHLLTFSQVVSAPVAGVEFVIV
jgi:hypothetical protein